MDLTFISQGQDIGKSEVVDSALACVHIAGLADTRAAIWSLNPRTDMYES